MAKTTIYRRYRDRQEMLAAALASLTQPPPPPDTSAAAPILEWLIGQCYNAIEKGIGVGGVAALLTDEDPAFTKLIRSLLVKHRQALADADSRNRKASRSAAIWTSGPCWTALWGPTWPSELAAVALSPGGPIASCAHCGRR